MIIDIDSSDQEQTGKEMEGLAWNYKDAWGLYSEVAFDELGLCHGVQLAPGNTQPGSTGVSMIEHCFSGTKFDEKKYLRLDSAYCYEDVTRTCMRLGVTYTITTNDAYTSWPSHIDEITHWEPWIYSEEDLKKAEKKI